MTRRPPGRPRAAPQGSAADWRRVGLRRTPQRDVILNLVRGSPTHPTAVQIHQDAVASIPGISLATVYRTLRVLKERGLIHEFGGAGVSSRYDGAIPDHEHVRCVRCGDVADIMLSGMDEVRQRVAEATGYRVSHHPLIFMGLCPHCSSSEKVRTPGARKPGSPDAEESRAGEETQKDSDWSRWYW
ncbi:MAG: transcriptional repressor [Gemmatimonadota bacterium]|nr:transcriptional repressor [Gemmatimonadota bacterium]MDP6528512.1 transcriptional repressor [Gemmatimonadota bacterium]MDP6803079.1 transcriptional repressor [Gemmatimonadota bacterium]MDP7031882.1 transcriptional repressor [Gemmatimonadota bacterium]